MVPTETGRTPMQYVVTYTKTFVAGPLAGMDYDDECSFATHIAAWDFADSLRDAKVIIPCAGSGKYTVSNVALIERAA
jgi:hypothetical protein